jgi:trehalose 6-phosphate phosphatase
VAVPAGELRAELLAPFAARPDRAGVFTDFDGTLAPIVDDPATARPLPAALDALRRLHERFARVGVISGRPVDVLAGVLGDDLYLSGLYGLEVLDGGERRDHPSAPAWRDAVAAAVARAGRELPRAVLVEPKGLSVTLHFRTAPDLADEVRRWAAAEAASSGLDVRPARQSVELHPPVEADKGTALLAAAAGLDAVCFLGDDVGDLPAFAALEGLRRAGRHVLRVGVHSDEAPPTLEDVVDVLVDGPAGAVRVLERLAA